MFSIQASIVVQEADGGRSNTVKSAHCQAQATWRRPRYPDAAFGEYLYTSELYSEPGQ